MKPATLLPSPTSRAGASPDSAAPGAHDLPRGPRHPAGDHHLLALTRLVVITALGVTLPPALAAMGYASLIWPAVGGALIALLATAVGYTWGLRSRDLRRSWLFYAGADTLVVVVLGLWLGSFMNVFLIVVVVELARIYRHGRFVLIGGAAAAGLMGLQFALLHRPDAPPVGLPASDQILLLLPASAVVVGCVALSLATFIRHYAHEMVSYEHAQAANAAELHVAHDIQTSLLAPREVRSGPWTIAAISVPAREVGGDFYDYCPVIGNGIGGIAIGDVSGKGIPAALQMAVVRTIFRIEARRRILPAETLTRINQSLQTEMQTQGMVTLLYAFVDPAAGVMHFSNAGHNYPVLLNGRAEELKLTGLPLGIDGDVEYAEHSVPLAPGNSVVFYTDGVVEAINPQGELFGFDRLLGMLETMRELPPGDIIRRVIQSVQGFAAGEPQSDDITIVVLHRGRETTGTAPSRDDGAVAVGAAAPAGPEPPWRAAGDDGAW